MMISHIFQQVHQDLEDQNINSLAVKGIQASLLIFGELDIVCSFSSMKSYPSMENHNSNAT
jgi:hypothetical protein